MSGDDRSTSFAKIAGVVTPGILLAAGCATLALPAQAQSGNLLNCVVYEGPEAGRLATCTGRVNARGPAWTFVLVGRAPNVVTRIEIYEPGSDKPRQTLEGLEVRPKLVARDGRTTGRAEFVLQDVNFDGSPDLRIATGAPDADGTAYRWFLFKRDQKEFQSTDMLDVVKSPAVSANRRLVLGRFRDERGRTGRIAFKWRAGKLAPIAATAQERTEDGRCVRSHYTVREGKFEKTRETDCASDIRDTDTRMDDPQVAPRAPLPGSNTRP